MVYQEKHFLFDQGRMGRKFVLVALVFSCVDIILEVIIKIGHM